MRILDWLRRRSAIKYLNSLPVDPPPASISDAQLTLDHLRIQRAQERLREAKADADSAVAMQLRTQNSNRPSRLFPVTLKHDGLEWVARMMTGGEDPRNDLIGTGECPEQALVNFDMKWYGMKT